MFGPPDRNARQARSAPLSEEYERDDDIEEVQQRISFKTAQKNAAADKDYTGVILDFIREAHAKWSVGGEGGGGKLEDFDAWAWREESPLENNVAWFARERAVYPVVDPRHHGFTSAARFVALCRSMSNRGSAQATKEFYLERPKELAPIDARRCWHVKLATLWLEKFKTFTDPKNYSEMLDPAFTAHMEEALMVLGEKQGLCAADDRDRLLSGSREQDRLWYFLTMQGGWTADKTFQLLGEVEKGSGQSKFSQLLVDLFLSGNPSATAGNPSTAAGTPRVVDVTKKRTVGNTTTTVTEQNKVITNVPIVPDDFGSNLWNDFTKCAAELKIKATESKFEGVILLPNRTNVIQAFLKEATEKSLTPSEVLISIELLCKDQEDLKDMLEDSKITSKDESKNLQKVKKYMTGYEGNVPGPVREYVESLKQNHALRSAANRHRIFFGSKANEILESRNEIFNLTKRIISWHRNFFVPHVVMPFLRSRQANAADAPWDFERFWLYAYEDNDDFNASLPSILETNRPADDLFADDFKKEDVAESFAQTLRREICKAVVRGRVAYVEEVYRNLLAADEAPPPYLADEDLRLIVAKTVSAVARMNALRDGRAQLVQGRDRRLEEARRETEALAYEYRHRTGGSMQLPWPSRAGHLRTFGGF
jgi:hypothetical protein